MPGIEEHLYSLSSIRITGTLSIDMAQQVNGDLADNCQYRTSDPIVAICQLFPESFWVQIAYS